ncbi:MAG: hypothetical protein M3Z66_14180 [Chloroflexota bacterium]|nr:hypothetical protein [Chloroflexota bacterium]
MYGKRTILSFASATILLIGAGGTVSAGSIPHQHIRGKLRVDGNSDLRGVVRARSGLNVTNGITTDSLTASGPAQVGGILTVSGATTTNGLNAGGGTIATTGALQGGSLAISGNATVSGTLNTSGALSAASASIGGGGLNVTGALQGNGASFNTLTTRAFIDNGAFSAASLSTNGSLSANSGSFNSLVVQSGGSVNFNGATLSNAGGLDLSNANLNVASLHVGNGGLTIEQSGRTNVLSVNGSGLLTTSGGLNVGQDLTVQGTLSTRSISSLTGIAVTSPSLTVQGALSVGNGGNLQLNTTSGIGPSHLIGNADTRGQCTAGAGTGGNNTCHVTFATGYSGTPVVVVTPVGGDPSLVTGYVVSVNQYGFTITFSVKQATTVTFNYLVEG